MESYDLKFEVKIAKRNGNIFACCPEFEAAPTASVSRLLGLDCWFAVQILGSSVIG